MVSGMNRGWSVLCGILLNGMGKNSIFHLKRGRGEKVIVSSQAKQKARVITLAKSKMDRYSKKEFIKSSIPSDWIIAVSYNLGINELAGKDQIVLYVMGSQKSN